MKGLSNIDDELLSGGCETILPLTGGFLQVVPSVPLLPQPISLCSKEKPEQILSLSIFVDPGCFLYQRIRMRFLLEAFFSSCEESGRDAAMKSALEQESKLFVNRDHDPDLSLSFLRTVSPHNLSRGLIYCTGADIGYWRMEAQAILLLQHAVVAFIRKIGINFQRRSETPRNTSESQNYLQVFLGSYSSAIKRSSQYCTSALLEFLQRDKSETDATRNLFSKAFPHTP